jgi:hypothetical protein
VGVLHDHHRRPTRPDEDVEHRLPCPLVVLAPQRLGQGWVGPGHVPQRPERPGRDEVVAPAGENPRVLRDGVAQRTHDGRLPDARLTADERDRAAAPARAVRRGEEPGDVLGALAQNQLRVTCLPGSNRR